MKKDLVKIAGEVLAGLKARYPVATTQLNYANPWELLVATVLAAQCTDARVNMVTPDFFRRWPSPKDLFSARLEEIESVIHSIGIYRNKAKNLLAAARLLCEKFNGEVPANMEDLLSLPGIARKTANIILFGGFGKNDGIAVDTHVKRISGRLGLTASADPVKIERDLAGLFPREEWGDLNHRMVWFGREVCKARNPLCEKCEFAKICRKDSGTAPRDMRKREKPDEP